MKKALIVFGTTAALLASVMAPTAGFAATKTEVSTTNSVFAQEEKEWITDVKGSKYYSNLNDVPETYYYVGTGTTGKGIWKGELRLKERTFNSKGVRGIYEGWIYKS
ncbi:hypothetical protein L3476_10955 [Paenibacillus thiaminolyticus]|uniref:hypothetical protein n=1 Tax=Paenibacillus thiaminolyticus TaxID=49283 RepID=UPI0023506CDD|nr:hypothetical protein [Paenibacillus thiaminolyticus]MDG0871272.1 hypothetical protein [Paenibacillus thiaminolyticus]WCR29186.1 hypothetical protein L3476_10955 [Paenibacillus thiaminolyticus]